jgi:UDP-N-acetylmuramoyl-L-alanyl-D-glutamate--2,6-diaminopimelate ligase
MARKAGAVGAVVQDPTALRFADEGFPLALVPDTQAALADLACAFYDAPSRKLRLLGVTGTNGKTTTAFLLDRLLQSVGQPTGLVGTLGAWALGQPVLSDRTTPESSDLQRLLRGMADQGARSVTMEVSSHSLELHRVRGCLFDGAVFTNLTQDHLDFHGSMEAYFGAKARLFTEYADQAVSAGKQFVAAINADDPWGAKLADMAHGTVLSFGTSEAAQVRASGVAVSAQGTSYLLSSPWGSATIRLRLIGHFNVANSLAAATLALGLGLSLEEVAEGLEALEGVPGRLEPIREGQPFSVAVDYAHTPDGVVQALKAARSLASARVLIVVGCGGDRDATKRPKMGRAAVEGADLVFVTSDNPRSEEPNAIIEQILTGIPSEDRPRVQVEPDRRLAIRRAVEAARPGDFVLIAGKGHETYQLVGGLTLHFDDREEAREAIRAAHA